MLYIYALCDPDTSEIRYVGKSNNPTRRLYLHVWNAGRKPVTHKDRWIKSLLTQGKKPTLKILEEVTLETWEARERAWIAGTPNLTNLLPGGECGGGMVGKTLSAEAKAKIGAAHRGKRPPFSDEWKAKIAAGVKKAFLNPAMRERHRTSLLGNQNARLA